MKRYECYTKDALGYRGEVLSEENLDGEWVRFEDAQAEIATLESVNEKWCNTIARLRDELTACQLERDALRNDKRAEFAALAAQGLATRGVNWSSPDFGQVYINTTAEIAVRIADALLKELAK